MWARKRFVLRVAVVVVLTSGLTTILWGYLAGSPTKTAVLPAQTYHLTIQSPPASGGRRAYFVKAAESAGDQARGLGGEASMPTDRGMLFVYTGDQQRCFWMKDMRFPIDMIWLDHSKAVTHVERNVSPSTYPNAFCYVGAYVVELNAGEAARSNLQTGQKITF